MLNSREKVKQIFSLQHQGGPAFWTGCPHPDTEKAYLKQLGIDHREKLFQIMQDDCRWMPADSSFRHPEGRPMFDVSLGKTQAQTGGGVFSECESLAEVEAFPWPDASYLDFSDLINEMRQYQDKAVLSGMWSPFFHILADFFGMEQYFIKMLTDPLIVEAVTEHVVDFFCEANDRFFTEAGDLFDTFFFGNDFGTQLDLLISPALFQKFVMPGFKRLIHVAKKHNKKVLLHSCGAISKVIPYLIDAGVDALHPLQAKAHQMDAVYLAREFKNDVAFVGGVDTQELLVSATPEQVREEVKRLREVLGANFVVSPSHEAILPNVPLANVLAMSEAAKTV